MLKLFFRKRITAVLFLCCFTLFIAVLLSANTNAVTKTARATVRVSSACSLTGTTGTPHTINLASGTYSGSNGFGLTTLKAFCNDAAGFAIYAIGYTGNEYGNTTLHWNKAASAADNTNAINTGVYTSGTTVNSTWSMKLNALSGTYAATIDDGVAAHNNSTDNFTVWHVVPDRYKRVAYRLSGTDVENNGSGTGSSITTTYDAYVAPTQPAGTYVGQVKYTLVHPGTSGAPVLPLDPTDAPAYSIVYAPNASDIIGDMSSLGAVASSATAGKQTTVSGAYGASNITSNTTSVRLIAPNFAREGYGFAGWSTDFTATSTSTIYGPNETISTNPANGGLDVSGGAVLYPVWIESTGNLQSWSGCSDLTPVSYDDQTGALTATLSSITALTDTRDGNVYTVARLADGQCWMTENLRLNSEHTTSAEDIAKAQRYGSSTTYGNFIGLASSEDANFSDTNPPVANTLYSTDGANNTININTTGNPFARIPRYNNNNTNMATNATNSDGITALNDSYNANNNHVRWYSYGNYYNWPAAMASTTSYYYYFTTSAHTGSDVAGTSLCPLGWHLPLGYQSTGTLTGTVADDALDSANRVGGFSYLDRRMGGTGQSNSTNSITNTTMSIYWSKFPNNFVYSGYWTVTIANNRGLTGFYWSSSSNDNNYTFLLSVSGSTVHPGTNPEDKYHGYSVRCMAGS